MTKQNIRSMAASCALASISILTIQPAFAATAFPAGTYTSGKNTITLDSSGKFRFTASDGKLLVEGLYSVAADQVRFTDQSGPMACLTPKDQAEGSYRWTYANAQLAFVKMDDKCEGRPEDLTAAPWTKK